MSDAATAENGAGDGEASPAAEAIRKLREAMRQAGGGTTDPDRRRAAATLSELVRSDDEDLARFASRHLAGRPVGDEALRELRELVHGVARLVAVQGRSPHASDLVGAVRHALFDRLEELEREQSGGADEPARDASSSRGVAIPVPEPLMAPVIAHSTEPRMPPPKAAMPSYLQAPAPSPWAPGGFAAPATPTAPAPMLAAQPPMAPPAAQPAFVNPPLQGGSPSASRFEIADEGTAMADAGGLTELGPEASLPFARSPSNTRQPVQHVDDDDSADGGRTGAYTYNEHLHAVEPAPISAGVRSLPVHLAMIDLESHATMTAMLQAYPERSADICARYGLTDVAERELLDEFWFSRFRRFPKEREEWARHRDQALAHYRTAR